MPSPLPRLRRLCLTLPEAHEVEAWGEPTFRVTKGKMFAMYARASNHHGAGRDSVWIKATKENQALMLRAQPDRFFKPPYAGPSGWVGVYLDKSPDWDEIRELLWDGWRLIAPETAGEERRATSAEADQQSAERQAQSVMTETFGSRVVEFYRQLRPPRLSGLGVDVLFPYRDPAVMQVTSAFYHKFFDDSSARVFLIGINPGRFGAGTTGIPFTDPVSLEKQCGIPNHFPRRRELSAEFFEALIERWGGPREFYRTFFFSAASPIGFTKGGKNYNYYDNPKLLAAVRPFIVKTMRAQLDFGARRDVAVVLGTGKNFAFLSRLNAEYKFFDKLLVVEHPRFIMQYRRKRVSEYLDKYEIMLRSLLT